MMRLGVIADLHGNLVGLEAALAALARAAVDHIVCLGDVAATGPQPVETIAHLREVGCPVVLGNADAELLDPPATPLPVSPPGEDAQRIAEIGRWCAAQLDAGDLAFLGSFEPTITLALGGGTTVLACHGSPRSFDDQMLPTTPDAELDTYLRGVSATIVLSGHTHRPMVRRFRNLLLLNSGSVGLPYDPVPPGSPGSPVRNPPWAEYAVVDAGGDGLAVTLGREPIDSERVVATAHASGMPHAAWWAADWTRSDRA